MRRLLVLLLFLSLVSANEKMIIAENPTFDAGVVVEGDQIVHDFYLFNRGKSPIRIKQVIASCGCTAVSYDRVIPPKGKAKITLKVNTANFEGEIVKSARVFTELAKKAFILLTIKAFVKPVVKLVPSSFVYVEKKEDEEVEKFVLLTSEIKPDFKVIRVSSSNSGVDVKAEKAEGGWRIKLIFTKRLRQGHFFGYVRVRTDLKRKPLIYLSFRGEVR